MCGTEFGRCALEAKSTGLDIMILYLFYTKNK